MISDVERLIYMYPYVVFGEMSVHVLCPLGRGFNLNIIIGLSDWLVLLPRAECLYL